MAIAITLRGTFNAQDECNAQVPKSNMKCALKQQQEVKWEWIKLEYVHHLICPKEIVDGKTFCYW